MRNLISLLTVSLLASAPALADKKIVVEFTTLNLMKEKGIITQAEYDSAMHDLADSVGTKAGESTSLVISKWSATLYGFAQVDVIGDSTQSFTDFPGNTQVARPGTFAGDHGRFTFAVRNSRIGFKLRAPEYHKVRATAQLEMDFLGPSPATTESAIFTNPLFRIRHMNFKLETPIVDVLFGQYWHLFGWQPLYHPNTVEIQGVPGQLYGRTPQLRVSKTIKTDPVTIELAIAMMRSPQRDSATPEGEAGARLAFNKWTGMTTNGAAGTTIQPLSVAVTADVRHFELAEFAATPKDTRAKTGWAIAADAYIPLVPATEKHKSNALSLNGEYAWGLGDADMYSQLVGGVIQAPALPNPTGATPAPTYTPNFDPGLVALSADGNAHLIQWQSVLVGVQYAFPKLNGLLWVSANYSHMDSNNSFLHGDAKKVRHTLDWVDANLFWDATPAVRLGLEYAWFSDEYVDGVVAIDHHVQLSGWYIF
jgi:hypothetical protein